MVHELLPLTKNAVRPFSSSMKRFAAIFAKLACMALISSCAAENPALNATPRGSRALRSSTPELEVEPGQILFAMKSHEAELRRCFFHAPTAHGTVRLGWRVDTAGTVSSVRVEESSLGSPDVESCLAERVAELHFEVRERPARARWTYVFRLVEPEAARAMQEASRKPRRTRRTKSEPGVEIEPSSTGFLATDSIDSVLESGYKLYAHCYRDGLDRDSKLAGSLRVRFVIAEDGSVKRVVDGQSDLPDPMLIDCVAEAFFALRFPKPSRGRVHVLYRVQFD
jgi:hypothetical protein